MERKFLGRRKNKRFLLDEIFIFPYNILVIPCIAVICLFLGKEVMLGNFNSYQFSSKEFDKNIAVDKEGILNETYFST